MIEPAFDVFLSHNSRDKAVVRQIWSALHERGLRAWLDEEDIIPGRDWQEQLENILKNIPAVAVLVGANGMGPWEVSEMRASLQRPENRKIAVIPVILPDAPEDLELSLFLSAYARVDMRGGLTPQSIDKLVHGITGKKPASPALATQEAATASPGAESPQETPGTKHTLAISGVEAGISGLPRTLPPATRAQGQSARVADRGKDPILRPFARFKLILITLAFIVMFIFSALIVIKKYNDGRAAGASQRASTPSSAAPGSTAVNPRPGASVPPSARPGASTPPSAATGSTAVNPRPAHDSSAATLAVQGGALRQPTPPEVGAHSSARSAKHPLSLRDKEQGAPPATAVSTPPVFPFKSIDKSPDTATISLSPSIVMHMQLVTRNVLYPGLRFTPYYISLDRLPTVALKLYQGSRDGVSTQVPEGGSDEAPLKGIWFEDATGIAKMLCVRIPTSYEWMNAAVASIIKPDRDTELVQDDPERLSTIQVDNKYGLTLFGPNDLPVQKHLYDDNVAVARRLGPAPGYLRVVAARGEAFNKC
jgi:TIR domain